MSVRDAKMQPAVPSAATAGLVFEGAVGLKVLQLDVSSVAVSQAAVRQDAKIIPFAFEVVRVDAYAKALVATAQVDVQINGVSILTGLITPATGVNPPANGTLVASRAGRRGAAGATLDLKATTNGTGTLTDIEVICWIRPYPLSGEAP